MGIRDSLIRDSSVSDVHETGSRAERVLAFMQQRIAQRPEAYRP